MRVILQRVSRARVRVRGETVGEIGPGFLGLVGLVRGDREDQVAAAARKIGGLRVFEDADGRMNLGPDEVGAEMLLVSQFTLIANLAKGRRPSFDRAADPSVAEPLFESLVAHLRVAGFRVETGVFGAHMEVELVNDGPVTLVLDVDEEGRVG